MNTRVPSLLLLLVAVFCASSCGQPDVPSTGTDGPSTPGLTPGLTPNEEVDAGRPDPSIDAGALDAGGPPDAGIVAGIDAGPACPPFTRPIEGECESEVSVRLTGTAAVIRGDTLYSGKGQQPVLEVFFAGPAGIVPDEVTVTLGRFLPDPVDAGTSETRSIASATLDDAGSHYDLAWPTTDLPEGRYQARATVVLGDAGFISNTIAMLVDRTPPTVDLKLSFDSDEQEQPRDFLATATVAAADDGGSGEVAIALSGTGVKLLPAGKDLSLHEATTVNLPAALPLVDGDHTTLQTRLYGGDVPYDAWSTKADVWPIEITATAADLLGNSASDTVKVAVTREIWRRVPIASSGPFSIGPQGQVLVNHGVSLDVLLPDGTLQSSTPIARAQGGGAIESTGAPETLITRKAPQGYTFVPSLVNRQPLIYGQVSSVGSDSFASITTAQAMALAVSASRELVYALAPDCALGSFDPLTGANLAPTGKANPFPASCAGASVAIGKNHLIAASASLDLSYSLSPLEGDWSWRLLGLPGGPLGAPPVFLGNLAVFDLGTDLELFDPSTGPDNHLMEPGGATPAKVVTSSQGDVFVLDSAETLTKLDSNGNRVWQRDLHQGSWPRGLALGVGANVIYASDGSGVLSAFDPKGNLLYKSLTGLIRGDLLIDRCTGHAYGQTLSAETAVVVDSFGLDLAAGSWPVTGHDAFQTYDAEGIADVDCDNHL